MASPLKVLVLEDSPNDAELLLHELRRGGYAPVHERVASADAMQAALAARPWDIVIAGHGTAGFDAAATLALLRERGHDLPLIVVSDSRGEDIAAELIQAGAQDYLVKGDYHRLIPAVRRALRETHTRQERERAEEQLRRSEQRFRQLAENIAEVFWITDPAKQEILYVSPGYEAIWGRSCANLYRQPSDWLDAIHQDDRARVQRAALAQASGSYDEEYRIVRPDGSLRWIRDRAFPIKDAAGTVYRITGIADDITERKLAEQALRDAKEFSENLIRTANVIILGLDLDGNINVFNEAAQSITGYTAAELCGQNWFERLVPRERYPQVWQEFTRLTAGGVPQVFENPILTKSGEERYVMWQNNHVRVNGEIVGTISFGNDITERKQAAEALKESEERLRMAINGAQMYTWDWDIKTGKVVRSGHYQQVYGAWDAAADCDYGTFLELIHPEDRDAFVRAVDLSVQQKTPFHTRFRVIRADGEIQCLESQGQVYCDHAGRPVRMSGVSQDVTQRERTEALIQHMAFYDSLTGLPNRNNLYDRLQQAIARNAPQRQSCALLLMDLNHFKDVNDTLGHHRGDMVLQEVGRRLKTGLFELDAVARLGGDEFAVLLSTLARPGDIAAVAQKIHDALSPPIMIEGLPIAVDPAIGIALFPEHGEDPDSLLRRADIAMYTAKKTGSHFVIYEPQYDQHSTERLALMGELREAIAQDHLVLHYQPKIDLKTNAICGAEALVRWRHPQRGMIPPDQFIGPAEQTGLIHALTRWVLCTAIRQCGEWRRDGLDIPLSVNLSARNLFDPKLPEQLKELLHCHGVAAGCLTLEITESAIMADPSRAVEILLKIHALGVRISIDDFGIGYSSLNYLRRLPVHCLKVDKSFVMNMLENQGDASIVCSTIALAHNLGLEVVAEGVEDKEVYARLVEWGCDMAQGYHMSRPLAALDFATWLHQSPWGLRQLDRG